MRTLTLLLTGCVAGMPALAQHASSGDRGFSADPFNHSMLPYYLVIALLIVAVILVAAVALYVIRFLNLLTEKAKKGSLENTDLILRPSGGWWQKMNASVPLEREKEIELEHSYDGIKELDNHLPPWWKWLFYGTIGWAAIYMFVFHFSNTLPLSEEEYHNEIAQAEEQLRKLKATQPETSVNEDALLYTADAVIIERGKSVFNNNPCGSCHRSDGGGNTIGPNLTDEYWIHGGDVRDIFNTIKNGAVDKGMPAWGKAMSSQDLRDVTFYILSLQGSHPPEAKAPQGEIFTNTTSIKSDTLKTEASL